MLGLRDSKNPLASRAAHCLCWSRTHLVVDLGTWKTLMSWPSFSSSNIFVTVIAVVTGSCYVAQSSLEHIVWPKVILAHDDRPALASLVLG